MSTELTLSDLGTMAAICHSPVRARFRPMTSIAKCTDKESSRYALGAVQIAPVLETEPAHTIEAPHDGEGPALGAMTATIVQERPVAEVYAVATDSRILAVNRIPGMSAETYLCPATMATPAKNGHVKIAELNGEWRALSYKQKTKERAAVMADPVDPEMRFPRVADIVPHSFTNAFTVRLNAKLLATLADAIAVEDVDSAAGAVTLIFSTDKGTTDGVISVLGNAGFGAIMPISLEKSTPEECQSDFISQATAFRNSMTGKNTPERQAAVLAILNPNQA